MRLIKVGLLLVCFGLLGGCSCDDDDAKEEVILLPDGGAVLPDGAPVVVLSDGRIVVDPSNDGAVVPVDDATSPWDGASPFTTNDGGQVLCKDHVCACNDGMDNDADGDADGFDPECTGAFDDDEGSFATGIPGDNRDPKWQDCFFDGNSGAGDDKCRYRTECLIVGEGGLPPTHPDCVVTQQCLDFCAPRTPNGCDCFGCCEVATGDGDTLTILIGDGCDLETADDCQPCVQSDQCVNECGTCELCAGKAVEDLPPECTPDGGAGGYTCDRGQPCSPEMPCAAFYFCQLGCCVPNPLL